MFASPGNSKLKKFVSRWPHHQAWAVDALQCSLENCTQVYANPPWSIIPQWLQRLQKNPHIVCLFVCPYWDPSSRWPPINKVAHTQTPCWSYGQKSSPQRQVTPALPQRCPSVAPPLPQRSPASTQRCPSVAPALPRRRPSVAPA